MTVGVTVAATEIPASANSLFSTQNGFAPAVTDWGPVGQAVPCTSLANVASQLGTPTGSGNPTASRTTTDSTVFDASQTFFNEDGIARPLLYVSRVVGTSPANATITLAPTAALTITAAYPGPGGNGIYVAVQNNTTTVTLTLTDSAGYVLASSPALGSLSACVSWLASTGLVTATSSGSTLPSTAAATALSGGSNGTGVNLASYTSALAAFTAPLGPGQVFAPGVTNTTFAGAWSALGTHAQAFNRVAICDMDDNVSAATEITDLGTFGTTGVASYCGFWAGSRSIPGVVPNTTRTVAPSPVIAALCARVDQSGNPNQAAAGTVFGPLAYATAAASLVSGAPYDTYSAADLNTLNAAGINTFQRVNGIPCNYGFVSPLLSSSDAIYWQFNHSRFRMALVAQAQLLGQPFVFAQLDGQANQAAAFNGALSNMLLPYAVSGALWAPPGTPPANAFTVDTGPDVNTPQTQALGQLNATITVSFSYFAQNVQININVVPITTLNVV